MRTGKLAQARNRFDDDDAIARDRAGLIYLNAIAGRNCVLCHVVRMLVGRRGRRSIKTSEVGTKPMRIPGNQSAAHLGSVRI